MARRKVPLVMVPEKPNKKARGEKETQKSDRSQDEEKKNDKAGREKEPRKSDSDREAAGDTSDESSARFTDDNSGGSEVELLQESSEEKEEEDVLLDEDDLELDEAQAAGKEAYIERLDNLYHTKEDDVMVDDVIGRLTENFSHGCLSAKEYLWLYGNHKRIIDGDLDGLSGEKRDAVRSVSEKWEAFFKETESAVTALHAAEAKRVELMKEIQRVANL